MGLRMTCSTTGFQGGAEVEHGGANRPIKQVLLHCSTTPSPYRERRWWWSGWSGLTCGRAVVEQNKQGQGAA